MLSIFVVLCSITLQNTKDIDSTQDEEKVKKSVLEWADTTFYFHEEYRFEQFHAHYTDEYSIAYLRANMFKTKMDNLKKSKEKGFYKKSDADYEAELSDIESKYNEMSTKAENFPNKVEFYEILFWSNIKTNHGITVYYSHHVKLNNDYQVISAEIKSAIGKKNESTEIIYAKDIKKKK